MKYQVQVTGEALIGLPEQDFEIDASDGHTAVDVARKKLTQLVPKEGGKLDIVVSALEPWERTVEKKGGGRITETFAAGVVSEFSVELEPHESVRAEVEAKRAAEEAAKAKAAERAALKAEILAEMTTSGELEVIK